MSINWKERLETEIDFWRTVIKEPVSEGVSWAASGIDVAPKRLHKYLKSDKRILDVGAGPITTLGRLLNGFVLNVTAVDPLAAEYETILSEAHVHPLVKTEYGKAEELASYVSGKYDFIYCRNALDHSEDPLTCIKEMIKLLAPGGVILLEHVMNEALRQGYQGLHFWNFLAADNDLVIWNNSEGYILSKHLKPYVDISLNVSTFVDDNLIFSSVSLEKRKC